MAKILVDTQTDLIRGYFEEPLDFSISGRYVLDIPPGLYPATEVVSDILVRKVSQYRSYHPTLPNYFNDELLAVPNIDTGNSFGYALGANKRTAIFPNSGYVTTNLMAVAAAPTNILIHCYGFLLYSDPGSIITHPKPSRLLYNYNPGFGFIDFNPATFQIQILDNTYSVIHTFSNADVIENTWVPGPVPSPGDQICLRFTNTDTTKIWHLSDWILMYG